MNGGPSLPSVTVVVPIKGLESAKSRLASHLGPDERSALVLRLLDHVLGVVAAWSAVERVVVVTPDPSVRARAEAIGAMTIDEVTGAGQNAALERARALARHWSPAAMLVLSGDLPLLGQADLEEIGRLGATEGTVVFAPDRHGVGTNALLLHPPDLIPFRFGPDSFQRHAQEAESRGLRVRVYRRIGTALDLDLPEDLNLVEKLARTSTRQ